MIGGPPSALGPILADARDFLLPETVLAVTGAVAVLARRRGSALAAAAVGVALAAISVVASIGEPRLGFGGTVVVDASSAVAVLGTLAAAAVALVLARIEDARPERVGLILLSTAGAMLAASAADLVVLVAGLALASLGLSAAFVVGARDGRAHEAAVKQLVAGAVALALVVEGSALVAVASGSTRFADVAEAIPMVAGGGGRHLVVLGSAALASGLLVAAGLAPFHLWLADAVDSAPRSLGAFLSVAPRAAALVALARVAGLGVPGLGAALAVAGGLSIVWGDLEAATGVRVRRVVASMSVAGAGVSLLAFGSGASIAIGAFAAMTLGALAGDIRTRAGRVAAAVFALGLSGLPPAPGALARIEAIDAILRSHGPLVVPLTAAGLVSIVASTVAAARIAKALYAEDENGVVGSARTMRMED